tara:strand:+ start:338 stop:442 length:105 start_codon:yes stop_codon:yes gene_type:complete
MKTEFDLIENGVFNVHNPSNEAAPGLFKKITNAI